MKTTMIILACLILLGCNTTTATFGLNNGGIIKPDLVNPDRINVYSVNGQITNYMKPDFIIQNQVNIFDNNGNRKGFIRPDFLNRKNYLIYK